MKKFATIIGMIGVLLGILLVGCVEKFEADLSNLATEGLVVEGDIVSDSTVVFKLSKTLPLTATGENEDLFANYKNVNAQLSVKGSDGSSWAGLLWGMGEYRVAIGTLQPEVEYWVEIQYDGDTYQSAPQKPLPCTPIAKLHFTQPELEGPVHVLLDTEEADETQYFLWYFEEDWEVQAHFQTLALYDPETKRVVDYSYPPVAQ